jgi:hypothetical protein
VISAKRGLKAMVMMLPCTSKLRTYNCTSVTTFAFERRESINELRALAAARKRRQLAGLKNTHLVYSKKDGLRQAFEHGDITLVKSESLIREHFQQSDDLSVISDGYREDGSNTESKAALSVHARVGLSIIAA